MILNNEKVAKKGIFHSIIYSSIKKYACEKGELTLTSKKLTINCEGKWKKTFLNKEIRLEAYDKILEIRAIWYSKLLFKLTVEDAEEWLNAFQKVQFEELHKYMDKFWEADKKRPEEWKKLFEIDPKVLRKIYDDIRKEMTQFRRKNLVFNLEI